jgi:ABC-type multidrug transport system permease subunit
MVSALFYLRITSFLNALVSRTKRLKQPKYLIGAIFGAAYIYFTVYRRLRMSHGVGSSTLGNSSFPVEQLAIISTLAAAVLMIFVMLCWIWPRARASLAFTEPEIVFLFPAPVSRSTLIHYRLIIMQSGLLFTSLVFAVFASGLSFLSASTVIRLLGWWILLATASLHVIASSFVITQLTDRGVTSGRRQLFILGIVALLVAAIATWVWRDLHGPESSDLVDLSSMASYLSTQFSVGPLRWLLLPAKWVVQPLLATDLHSFLLALGPALGVFAVHYLWVLRTEVSFEDGSIASAEKRAVKLAEVRAGKVRFGHAEPKARRAPFNLSRAPRPELAFLWKNLLSSSEILQPRSALIATALIVIGCHWLTRNPDYAAAESVVAIFSMSMAGYVLFLGPLVARQDLRSDLLNVDILKTFPLRGWQIIVGEILTPVVVITTLVWLLLLAASLTIQPQHMGGLTPTMRTSMAIAIALLIPLLCAVPILIINGATMLFPTWMQTSQTRAGGIEVMGQRIFFFAGLFIMNVVALLPAAVIAGIGYFVAHWIVGVPIAAVIADLIVMVVLSVEVYFATLWLGERFEQFDLSAELRP